MASDRNTVIYKPVQYHLQRYGSTVAGLKSCAKDGNFPPEPISFQESIVGPNNFGAGQHRNHANACSRAQRNEVTRKVERWPTTGVA